MDDGRNDDQQTGIKGAGMSRRAILRTGAVTGAIAAGSLGIAGAAAAATGAGATGSSGSRRTSPAGDLILYNGRIHTMDGRGTVAQVVAIQDGVIVYVGNSLGVAKQQFTSLPQIINLQGRVAVPGLIDAHNHIALMGNRPGHHTPLENARSIADVQSLYAARAATLPKSPNPPVSADDFITTLGGFSANQLKEVRLPTLAELDAAVPHHPVYISVGFTGPSVTNTLGKAFFEKVAPPVGPVPVGADGSIAAAPFLSPGPTGQATLAWDSDASIPVATARLQNAYPFFGNDLVRAGAAGEFFADIFHYAGGSGSPIWMNAALAIANAGWRAEVHSITSADFQAQIEGFEAVNAQVPITGLRWVVAHVPFITPDYTARLKALGGGVNLTAYPYLDTVSPGGPPYRMLVDSGIPVGLSSDGMQIAPMNPWIHAYYATTGRNALGTQINPGQQLTRQEVLKHFTSANQWFLGGQDEDLLGALEVGRLGDVVVLSDDYFAVADEDLKKLHSVLTVLGGRVVHTGGIKYWA
jgi:predicted amidohydrolase YtcJ